MYVQFMMEKKGEREGGGRRINMDLNRKVFFSLRYIKSISSGNPLKRE